MGLVAARLGMSTSDAYAVLQHAADSAGIAEVQAAQVVLALLS